MQDINSLGVQIIGKEKEITETEKVLKMYADGYMWNPYTVRMDLWRTKIPMIKVEGWNV